jgi:hypothetical protein
LKIPFTFSVELFKQSKAVHDLGPVSIIDLNEDEHQSQANVYLVFRGVDDPGSFAARNKMEPRFHQLAKQFCASLNEAIDDPAVRFGIKSFRFDGLGAWFVLNQYQRTVSVYFRFYDR